MLFSSCIVIRTTSSWMRSCLVTRFDTENANVNELPSCESCSSPEPWGLLVFLILETVSHCDPMQGQKQLFTVISTGTLCQSDGREYSLYMRACLTVFTLRWYLATLMLPLSAAGRLWEICCINDVFPATRANVQNVQNAALRASEIRILPHKL